MGMKENKMYECWLCSIPGVGNRTIERLLALCGSARRVYEAPVELINGVLRQKQQEAFENARKLQPKELYENLTKQQIDFVFYGEEGYPKRLLSIPDAPRGLFFKGRMPEDDRLAVAVIGARDCSEYGRYVAEELGKYLGKNGVQVISGMARGIDGISQRMAICQGGMTTAVLGCGVDICYPPQNRQLYDAILEKGGVLSPYPPGTPPRAGNFPPRNRIVSGLADAVVVIEARVKSGTLITVDMALEQGREVYVVPGRVTDRLSDGCNRLLKQGAALFLSPQDFLRELTWGLTAGRGAEEKKRYGEEQNIEEETAEKLTERQRLVYQQLELTPQSLEELLERMREKTQGFTAAGLATVLMQLELEGCVKQNSQGHFSRK